MRPDALVIAGPNGSGKSTLIRQLQSEPAFHFPENYINADDIERELIANGVETKAEEARQTERKAMATLGGDDGLDLPEEENGQYTGIVFAAGTHYLVQEVIADGLTTLYRHDALWLADPPQPEWTGKTALIHYGQSEYGLATVSFS